MTVSKQTQSGPTRWCATTSLDKASWSVRYSFQPLLRPHLITLSRNLFWDIRHVFGIHDIKKRYYKNDKYHFLCFLCLCFIHFFDITYISSYVRNNFVGNNKNLLFTLSVVQTPFYFMDLLLRLRITDRILCNRSLLSIYPNMHKLCLSFTVAKII